MLIAPCRAKRPRALSAGAADSQPPPTDNPFLVGREQETPPESFRLVETEADWDVRVVGNRYPAVEPLTAVVRGDELRTAEGGRGLHEVIVECPDFETELASLSVPQITRVLAAWQQRLKTIESEGQWDYVSVFKNNGAAAGASLPHAHSQLIASSRVMPAIETEVANARTWYAETGAPLLDALSAAEFTNGSGVCRTDTLTAFCPSASRFGYETWVTPLTQIPFADLGRPALREIAALLKPLLQAIAHETGCTDYNLLLHATPFSVCREPWFRWRLEICPRPAGIAGYELATGCFINPVAPEAAARALRAALNHGKDRGSRESCGANSD